MAHPCPQKYFNDEIIPTFLRINFSLVGLQLKLATATK